MGKEEQDGRPQGSQLLARRWEVLRGSGPGALPFLWSGTGGVRRQADRNVSAMSPSRPETRPSFSSGLALLTSSFLISFDAAIKF